MIGQEDHERFEDWWDDLIFYDEEGKEYSSEEYDYGDRIWAIEYAYVNGWDEQEIMDMMYEESADFWDWWRTNYEEG